MAETPEKTHPALEATKESSALPRIAETSKEFPADAGDNSDSLDLSSSGEPIIDTVAPSFQASFEKNSMHRGLSQHRQTSARSLGSQNSNSSLKVFRRASSWRNSGHESLSFLEEPSDDVDESENAADENDLGVLCSRHSKRLKLLGEGASGEVWLVRHNHKSYALKVCAKYDLLTEGGVHEVVREREIMSQLDHPFIARIWATNQDKDFVYILEDYLAGGEFYSVLERQPNGRIGAPQAQVYAACIADALAYLHQKHIVYRDLKPENIMVSKRGFPTLIDFGCAKILTAEENYMTRTLIGTPRFASPEMIDPSSFGGGHSVGTDHWALGILIFEALAGENPFWYESMAEHELYEQIPVVEPCWKLLTDLDLPEDIVDFLQKLLIKDPAKRLGSGGEDEILKHQWLAPVNVREMGRVEAPWVPDLTDPTDTQYFEAWEEQVQSRFNQSFPSLSPKEELQFAEF